MSNPPDPEAWKQAASLVATTFDQLIYNVDRNTGNLLITKDWKLVLIDHTRAFAPNPRLMDRPDFDRCSRLCSMHLQELDARKTRGRLLTPVSDARTSRRDAAQARSDRQTLQQAYCGEGRGCSSVSVVDAGTFTPKNPVRDRTRN